MCLIAYVDIFIGCACIFAAVILAQLNEPTSLLKVNKEEASWIGRYTRFSKLKKLVFNRKSFEYKLYFYFQNNIMVRLCIKLLFLNKK